MESNLKKERHLGCDDFSYYAIKENGDVIAVTEKVYCRANVILLQYPDITYIKYVGDGKDCKFEIGF